MPQYSISLPDPAAARGSDPDLSFTANGADAFAQQLQAALSTDSLFQRWLAKQPDPDDVDPSLGKTDPGAVVGGEQKDLRINLTVKTTIDGDILKQRLHWLAGHHWEMRDVR